MYPSVVACSLYSLHSHRVRTLLHTEGRTRTYSAPDAAHVYTDEGTISCTVQLYRVCTSAVNVDTDYDIIICTVQMYRVYTSTQHIESLFRQLWVHLLQLCRSLLDILLSTNKIHGWSEVTLYDTGHKQSGPMQNFWGKVCSMAKNYLTIDSVNNH